MIPTEYKAKIAHTLSWPIGAEALSTALADAPQLAEFKLTFYDQPVWPATEFQRLLRANLPYRILELKYAPASHPSLSASNYLIEEGWYDASWKLTIYPVLRPLRHAAAELLREQGLPAVVAWLQSAKVPGWLNRRHALELIFDPAGPALTTSQSEGV
jgi:hypothetical protein